jgi:hypothetical protein
MEVYYIRIRLSVVVALVVIVAIILGAGFVHIVHGGAVGLTVCTKDGWSLTDTFVDIDDFKGQPLATLLPKASVIRALIRCQVLTRGFFVPPGVVREKLQQSYIDKLQTALASRSIIARIKRDGNVVVIDTTSENCDRALPIVRTITDDIPDHQRVRCDTSLRVPWELQEQNGEMVSR